MLLNDIANRYDGLTIQDNYRKDGAHVIIEALNFKGEFSFNILEDKSKILIHFETDFEDKYGILKAQLSDSALSEHLDSLIINFSEYDDDIILSSLCQKTGYYDDFTKKEIFVGDGITVEIDVDKYKDFYSIEKIDKDKFNEDTIEMSGFIFQDNQSNCYFNWESSNFADHSSTQYKLEDIFNIGSKIHKIIPRSYTLKQLEEDGILYNRSTEYTDLSTPEKREEFEKSKGVHKGTRRKAKIKRPSRLRNAML